MLSGLGKIDEFLQIFKTFSVEFQHATVLHVSDKTDLNISGPSVVRFNSFGKSSILMREVSSIEKRSDLIL